MGTDDDNSLAMKALIKKRADPGLWLEDVALPSLEPNDVLIRVDRTSLNTSDIQVYRWDDWAQKNVQTPVVIGSQFVGEVVALGANATDFSPGELVGAQQHIVCGRCRHCLAGRRHLCADVLQVGIHRHGCLAEYIALPISNVWHHREDIDRDTACVFEPFCRAVHTTLSFPVAGQDILITGAGPTGLMAMAMARHAGAHHVVLTDLNDYRLELARSMGATRAVNIRNASLKDLQLELGMVEGFDVGLETSGNPLAMRDIIDNVRHGGGIAMLSFPPESMSVGWSKIIGNQLTLKGTFCRDVYEEWHKTTVMLDNGLSIKPVITHHFHYTEWEKAFELVAMANTGKVVLHWRPDDARA